MGVIEDLAAQVVAQRETIGKLADALASLAAKVAPSREVYTLRDLTELPESPPLPSLRSHPERQPRGGVADGYRGREKCWRRETVEEWRRELSAVPGGKGGEA